MPQEPLEMFCQSHIKIAQDHFRLLKLKLQDTSNLYFYMTQHHLRYQTYGESLSGWEELRQIHDQLADFGRDGIPKIVQA